MADISDTLKSLLGDNPEEKIKEVLSSVSGGNDGGMISDNAMVSGSAGTGAGVGAGMGDIMQLKNMLDGMTKSNNDPRTNLLMSLRPYMREGRQQSIDGAVKLMGIMNIIGMLGK